MKLFDLLTEKPEEVLKSDAELTVKEANLILQGAQLSLEREQAELTKNMRIAKKHSPFDPEAIYEIQVQLDFIEHKAKFYEQLHEELFD